MMERLRGAEGSPHCLDYPFKHRLIALAEAEARLCRQSEPDDPRLAALRGANARELELIVDEDGWPTTAEAGDEGTLAALRIALNATERPAFMRRCLTLMKAAVNRGDLPAAHAEELERRLAGL
ncbi:MAG TPA: hypothetical protein VLL76_04925 [Candidatus Omnitrophota bacterium]|nr:hypothetical protein [Candidatus Omnitrophota bacterium]